MMEKAKKLGVMCSPNVIFGVGKQDGKWVGCFDIGDYYYETDPYRTKQDALLELRGCIIGIMDDLQKELNDMTNELG